MKKKVLASAVIVVLLVSCSDSSEDFNAAASDLCMCMKQTGNADDESMLKVNLGVCLLDAGVDLKDPQMSKAVEARCPEMRKRFDEYMKSM